MATLVRKRTGQKQVTLIDAVNWSPEYPSDHPLRNVPDWFGRQLRTVPGFAMNAVPIEALDIDTILDETDAVVISGSPRDAWASDAVNQQLCEFILRCREEKKPLLGVCFGHQILARALGGKVGPEPKGLELGNAEVSLTQAGVESPLFHGLDRRFNVIQGHRDSVLELPPECELLATGSHTRVQAFHWNNRLFGVQFHPEMDPEVLRFLWGPRRESWQPRVSFNISQVLEDLKPAPLAPRILANFLTFFAE